MSLIDALTSQAWMLHQPVFDRLAALIGRRAETGEAFGAIGEKDLTALREDRQRRSQSRRHDWAALLPSASTISETIDPRQVNGTGPGYFVVNGVAVVPVEGILARHSSMVNGASQETGMSYGEVISVLRAAVENPAVNSVLMDFMSPGGSAHGVDEAAQAIRELAAIKPIVAYAHQMAASAAYYLACACSMIAISPDGEVGSIGTVIGTYDYSQSFAIKGIKPVVVSSGPMKGAGFAGAPIGPDLIAEWQKTVDAFAGTFRGFVAARRGMNQQQIAQVSDGRMFMASEAVPLRLADQVLTPAQAIERARSIGQAMKNTTGTRPAAKGNTMNEFTDEQISALPADVIARISAAHKLAPASAAAPTPTPTPTAPATFDELDAAFPEDATHVRDSLKARHTIAQAQAAYAAKQGEQLTAANAKIAELQNQLSALQAQNTQLAAAANARGLKAPGVAPVSVATPGADSAGGPVAVFAAEVKKRMDADSKLSKEAAMHAVATDPKTRNAHRAWLDAGCPAFE